LILSQCGTLFALRMGNERDLNIVAATLPESARALLDALPSLRRQDALVVGEGVTVPMQVHFDFLPPEYRPRSSSARFAEAWSDERAETLFVEDGVSRWRHQGRNPVDPRPAPQPSRGGGLLGGRKTGPVVV
jgi:DNA helicase HerA-like ATPase